MWLLIKRILPNFGTFAKNILSSQNRKCLYVPKGFAHGFFTLSDSATIEYLVDAPYDPENQRCLIWNDPLIAIDWPEKIEPILSNKDANGLCFTSIKRFFNWKLLLYLKLKNLIWGCPLNVSVTILISRENVQIY